MIPIPSRRGRLPFEASSLKRRKFRLELLEPRAMMAADLDSPLIASSVAVESQVLAAQQNSVLAKSGVSPLLTSLVAPSATAPKNDMSDYLMWDQSGRLDVHFSGEDVAAVLDKAAEIGFEPLYVNLDHNSIDGYLTVSGISSLKTALSGLSVGVTPNFRPQTGAGTVTSEADVVLQTERLRQLLPAGYDGAGMRVGVLSDSYNNLAGAAGDVASGDLPAGVTVLQDLASGGIDEGRAMLQLVHDVAPAANLAFATAFVGGQAGFAANINALATTFNADVITDDVFYFAEPYFQDGLIAQAVSNVVQNSDVAYFSLAGNLSDQAFEMSAPFATGSTSFSANSFGTPTVIVPSAIDLNPGAGVDFRQSFTLNSGQRAVIGIQWDSPFFSSVTTDLDIYIVDQATNQLASFSEVDNIANDEPVEVVGLTNISTLSRTYEIIVGKFAGNPGRIKWVNFGANNFGPINTIEYDTNSPTIIPHSGVANAMSVGAVPYFDQKTPETYTSIGPVTVLFAPNGAPITPITRAKPDLVALDGTNTTFFGSDTEGDGRPNFFGTSAAAPHAAAVAAIVRQANPSFDAAAVYARMKQTAFDIAAPGPDNVTGVGLVNAFKAVFPTVATPSLPVTDDFSSGLTAKWEVSSTNNGRVRQFSTGANGDNQLVMDTFFGFTNSLNEATLHFNASGVPDIELNFTWREFADEDNPMPATFTGSNLSDGVALSVDGTNWFRLVSLTGTDSSSTFTNKKFNLSQFALTNGLTLGSDVRIKFQQYDNSPITSDGFAFDNISIAKAPSVAPVFGQASYAFSLAETAASGAAVGAVSASDGNLGDILTYNITGTGSDNFVVNASTGAITVSPTASFNAVLNPTYNLTAAVSDGTVSVNVPLTITLTAVVAVADTNVYYAGSAFAAGGVNAGLDPSKDLAQSGTAPVLLNYSNLLNTTFGINGVVLDVARMPGTTLAAADFLFRMSPQGLFNAAANPPSAWASAPAPAVINVTPATATTPARVRLEWNANAIANRWLQVQVLNTANTGLPVTQVYYIGHLRGELNGDAAVASAYFVTNADLALVNPIGGVATVSSIRDVDKNGFVLNSDGLAIRSSVNSGLNLRNITIPIAGSAAEGRVAGRPAGSGALLATPQVMLSTTNDSPRVNALRQQRLVVQTPASSVANSASSGTAITSGAATLSASSGSTSAAKNVDAVFASLGDIQLGSDLRQ